MRAFGILLCAATLVAATATLAQTTPVAAAAPSTPPAAPPDDSLLRCSQASLTQLLPAIVPATRGWATPANSVFPGNAETDVTFIEPGLSPDHLQFQAFLAWPKGDGLQFKPEGARVLSMLKIEHPPLPAQTATPLSGTDNQNAYGLHVGVPDKPLIDPREERALVIVACGKGPTASAGFAADDQVLGFAVRNVVVSTQRGALLIAAALMFVLYLLTVTIVWAKRNRESVRANKLTAILPQRVRLFDAPKWRECLDPVVLSADTFNSASLSKLQILFFIGLVGFGATYSYVRTGSLSDLSPSIVYLLGIPALGTLGNQVAAASRDRFTLDNWAWLAGRGVLPINDPGCDEPRWVDLVMSGSELDLYKLQALTFSLVVGIAMIMSGFSDLAKFNVPDTLLQILGLSQFVFVGGRFVKPSSYAEIDSLITELRKRAATVRAAAASGVDVDVNGKSLDHKAAKAPAHPPHTLAQAEAIVPNAVARYLETEREVGLVLTAMTHRDVDTKDLKNPMLP